MGIPLLSVPFNELREISRGQNERIVGVLGQILDSGIFLFGNETQKFVENLSEYLGVGHVVPVANGTDALEISLRALGVGPGDTVLGVANAGGYGTIAIRQVGAIPIYVDVSDTNLLMDPAELERILGRGDLAPRALILTHLFGVMGPLDAVLSICRRYSVSVIEDCAQSIGVRGVDGHVGTFGDFGTFSFYPTKNLGGIGDSGAIVTNSAELAAKAKALAQYGWSEKYVACTPMGRNSRMDEIQAAVLRLRLPELENQNRKRLEIYRQYLSVSKSLDFVHRNQQEHNGHLAVLRVKDRKEAQAALLKNGVETMIHYPVGDHQQAAFGSNEVSLPVTEASTADIISVPCHPRMTDQQVAVVSSALAALVM